MRGHKLIHNTLLHACTHNSSCAHMIYTDQMKTRFPVAHGYQVISVHAGKVMQKFDHSSDDTEKEFMCGSCNPTGHTCVMGSYNRLRMFNYSNRRDTWEEGPCKDIPNLYTITGLSWRKDGSKLAVVRREGGGGGGEGME